MNIGGIIRGLVGDAQIQEPKTLELKVGQVVKGVVQQQLPNQEALVNIGGVQVRAQLETPLKQGEMTMLQVQPESANGQIVLKPLQASQVQIADTSMGEVLKTLGMSDTPENRQLVQVLHQNGVAITKESVKAFTDLQAALGKSMPQAEWLPTAVLAFQKGLPLTPETVLSLRQTVQGPPFHQVLDQLAEVLNRAEQGGKELTPQTRVLLDTVKTLLAQVREAGGQLTQAGTSGASGAPAPQASVVGAGVASGASAPQASVVGAGVASGALAPQAGVVVAGGASAPQAGAGVASGAPAPQAGVVVAGGASVPQAGTVVAGGAPAPQAGTVVAGGASAPQAGVVGAGGASAPQAGVVGAGGASAPQAGVVGAGGASAPQAGVVVAGGASAPQAGVVVAGGAPAPQAGSQSPTASASLPQAAPAASDGAPRAAEAPAPHQPGQTSVRPAEPQEHLLGRLMKTIGIEHEHQAVRMLGTEGGNSLLSTGAEKHADSLKSALMQLAQSADAPDDIKQAAQQAVHQITGQQLLLSADRSAIFSHITMFVPLVQSDGTQTAAIHIQSRKGKNGSLDSENCRLVFDLQMKALGNTLVDVKVVNRIVSLHVHNDLPYTQTLLESYRDEIAGGLTSIGYQFISMKVSPYPEKLGDLGDLSAAGGKELPPGAVPGVYAQKPYKGVDIRL